MDQPGSGADAGEVLDPGRQARRRCGGRALDERGHLRRPWRRSQCRPEQALVVEPPGQVADLADLVGHDYVADRAGCVEPIGTRPVAAGPRGDLGNPAHAEPARSTRPRGPRIAARRRTRHQRLWGRGLRAKKIKTWRKISLSFLSRRALAFSPDLSQLLIGRPLPVAATDPGLRDPATNRLIDQDLKACPTSAAASPTGIPASTAAPDAPTSRRSPDRSSPARMRPSDTQGRGGKSGALRLGGGGPP